MENANRHHNYFTCVSFLFYLDLKTPSINVFVLLDGNPIANKYLQLLHSTARIQKYRRPHGSIYGAAARLVFAAWRRGSRSRARLGPILLVVQSDVNRGALSATFAAKRPQDAT